MTRGGTPLPSRSCSRNLCAPRRAVRSYGRGSTPRSSGTSHGGVLRSAAISTTAALPLSSFSAVRGVETLPAALGPHLQLYTYWQGTPRASMSRRRPPRNTSSPCLAPVIVSPTLHCLPTSCCPAAITPFHQAPSSQHLFAIYLISEMQFSLVARTGRMRELKPTPLDIQTRSSPWPV